VKDHCRPLSVEWEHFIEEEGLEVADELALEFLVRYPALRIESLDGIKLFPRVYLRVLDKKAEEVVEKVFKRLKLFHLYVTPLCN
jgi:hypothetical protein